MITLWLEDKESFLKRYHQRSKAESVYSSLKRCYGNYLSSPKRKAQRRELHLRTLTYNIGVDNLTNIREQKGKLSTPHPNVSVIRMFRVERKAARKGWVENYDEEDGSSAESLRVAEVRRSQQRCESTRE